MSRLPSHSVARQSSSLQGSIFSGASSGSLAKRDLRCTRREIVIPALVPGIPIRKPFEWRARIRPGEYGAKTMREQSPADPDVIMKDAFAAEPHDGRRLPFSTVW